MSALRPHRRTEPARWPRTPAGPGTCDPNGCCTPTGRRCRSAGKATTTTRRARPPPPARSRPPAAASTGPGGCKWSAGTTASTRSSTRHWPAPPASTPTPGSAAGTAPGGKPSTSPKPGPSPQQGCPHLVDAGDVLQVERGPRSRTMDLREVQSIRPGTGAAAGGLEFKVTGIRSLLFYPPNTRVPVCIPDEHPSLPAAIHAALAAAADSTGTADPAPDVSPVRGSRRPATQDTAPATPRPAPAAPPAAAGSGGPEPGASPLTNSDLAAGLRRLPGFARWLSPGPDRPARETWTPSAPAKARS